MPEPLSLPLTCRHCGGPVELQSVDADSHGPVDDVWPCPHCHAINTLTVPWRIGWVAKPGESKASRR